MDWKNPVESRSKTPAHDRAQRCRQAAAATKTEGRVLLLPGNLQPIWSQEPCWGTASNGPFQKPLPQDTKVVWIYPGSDRKSTLASKYCVLNSCVSRVQIEHLQERTALLLYKTFTSCLVMPLLLFCSLAAWRVLLPVGGTAGTMGSQWHSRIRWRSQLRLHTSLAVTPLCWHLDGHTHTDESSTCLSGVVRGRERSSHRPLLT